MELSELDSHSVPPRKAAFTRKALYIPQTLRLGNKQNSAHVLPLRIFAAVCPQFVFAHYQVIFFYTERTGYDLNLYSGGTILISTKLPAILIEIGGRAEEVTGKSIYPFMKRHFLWNGIFTAEQC
jgi:hypothetical protein